MDRTNGSVAWRDLFFAVNFGAAILLVAACAIGIGEALVGGGSPFSLFVLLTNVAEAEVEGRSPGIGFWSGFGALCSGIAAYCFWCCWYRVTHQAPGFSVTPRRPRP